MQQLLYLFITGIRLGFVFENMRLASDWRRSWAGASAGVGMSTIERSSISGLQQPKLLRMMMKMVMMLQMVMMMVWAGASAKG